MISSSCPAAPGRARPARRAAARAVGPAAPTGRRPARPRAPCRVARASEPAGQQLVEPAGQAGGRAVGVRDQPEQQPQLAGQPDPPVGAGQQARLRLRLRQPRRDDRPLVRPAGPELRVVHQGLGLPERRHRVGDPPVPPQPAGAGDQQAGVVGQAAGRPGGAQSRSSSAGSDDAVCCSSRATAPQSSARAWARTAARRSGRSAPAARRCASTGPGAAGPHSSTSDHLQVGVQHLVVAVGGAVVGAEW